MPQRGWLARAVERADALRPSTGLGAQERGRSDSSLVAFPASGVGPGQPASLRHRSKCFGANAHAVAPPAAIDLRHTAGEIDVIRKSSIRIGGTSAVPGLS